MPKFRVLIAAGMLLAAFAAAGAQQPQPASLPAVSFTCPMDPDVIADRAGTCPRCGMTLVPVRLDAAYSCPLHPAVIETKPGACRICRRPLVAVTVSLFWTCAGHADVHELSPGVCADGQPRIVARERRAHGDHNPRHGGQFFMASDNWHHLEGTYPSTGVFRIFLYDDFTRPIPLRGIAARAVVQRTSAPGATSDANEASILLTPAAHGRYLEARLPVALPADVTANVRFSPDGPEHRFDFIFPTYTKEPAPGAAPVAMPTPPVRLEAAAPGSAATIAALITALLAGNEQVDVLLRQGALAQLYIPALAAKDAALALDAHVDALPADRRASATAAVKRIVVTAWSIDRDGDLGDRRRLDEACQSFADAIRELTEAYAPVR